MSKGHVKGCPGCLALEARKKREESRKDALALIVGRLQHFVSGAGMWEESKQALLMLGYTEAEIEAAVKRYFEL